jgi:hypothetical protein
VRGWVLALALLTSASTFAQSPRPLRFIRLGVVFDEAFVVNSVQDPIQSIADTLREDLKIVSGTPINVVDLTDYTVVATNFNAIGD